MACCACPHEPQPESTYFESRWSFAMLILLQSFRIIELEWACSSAGRAPALQVSNINHISAASGVAYTETRGATTLLNWTDVGPTTSKCRSVKEFMRLVASPCVSKCRSSTDTKSATERIHRE